MNAEKYITKKILNEPHEVLWNEIWPVVAKLMEDYAKHNAKKRYKEAWKFIAPYVINGKLARKALRIASGKTK